MQRIEIPWIASAKNLAVDINLMFMSTWHSKVGGHQIDYRLPEQLEMGVNNIKTKDKPCATTAPFDNRLSCAGRSARDITYSIWLPQSKQSMRRFAQTKCWITFAQHVRPHFTSSATDGQALSAEEELQTVQKRKLTRDRFLGSSVEFWYSACCYCRYEKGSWNVRTRLIRQHWTDILQHLTCIHSISHTLFRNIHEVCSGCITKELSSLPLPFCQLQFTISTRLQMVWL